MDENFAYWSASFQRAGKWFSSSLALGTDVVADITDRIPSDMPCYHDRARCHRSFYFNPHGGPITQSSTGSERDSPVYPLCRSILCSWLCVLSRATLREMIYSRCSEPHSPTLFRYQSFVHPLETSYCTFILCSRCFIKFQLERYFCLIP